MRALCLVVATLVLVTAVLYAGTTGKIAGTVVDARTGEPLPSVNVTVPGTTLGASTNVDGYFVILNVPPGSYRLVASLVGYRNSAAVSVRVDIDQTTTQNFRLSEEAISSEEVTVVATRPVVQRDVSASRANIEIQDVAKLPVTSVTAAVGYQAGIQGLSIRGGTSDQVAFVVDGMVLRDERTNNPYTGISLSAVQDIQVQTGGFNAEYGNIRSGVLNVVTREGGRANYSFNFIGRYSPAGPKHFGPSLYDFNSYWVRPYVDDAVAWTGTGKDYEPGVWDKWQRAQYPEFPGWNKVSQNLLSNSNPNDDLTPQEAQRMWLWEHRKRAEIKDPDWDVDMGLGGPIPGGDALGNLRFFAAYRQSRNYYLIPLSTSSYDEQNAQLKITTDLSGTMKLQLFGLWGRQAGTNSNNTGEAGIFSSVSGVANVLSTYTSGLSYSDARIFGDSYYCPSEVLLNTVGAKFTNNISANSFYEVVVQRYEQSTSTNPGRARDTSRVNLFGSSYYIDEAPYGYQPNPSTGIWGLRMGVGMSNSRDSSKVITYTAKADITSQLDRYNQLKAGLEFNYTDNNIRANSIDTFLPSGRYQTRWHNYPIRGAVYLQDKLEFEGMVANLGVRLDYLNPNGDWYDNYSPFDPSFKSYNTGIDTSVGKSKVKPQLNVSPRLGVAFPISEDSKLYFNYGHFRQIPDPRTLFLLRRYSDNNQIVYIADPSAPLPKTVAYELGYEHSLFDEYLLRVAGYYKDISNEAYSVSYVGTSISYSQFTNNRYRDQRGFEFSLYKNRGNWIQGFVNYTYAVQTTGYFGLPSYNENPQEQQKTERQNYYQEKPLPQPYARANIDLFTPREFGPDLFGLRLLGDWRINFLGSWAAGSYFTWTGGGSIPGIQYNVKWNNTYNIDMRVSKNFQFGKVGIQFFADVSNLLNSKFISTYGFTDGTDYQAYLFSLHLPTDITNELGYPNIPGDDNPGDYRKEGVAYQPMVALASLADLNSTNYQTPRPIFWVKETGKYYQYTAAGGWKEADQALVDRTLDDKAYIDMPNQETTTFLNPRNIFYGLRLTYDF
jgi:hypothetical protein